jgi:multidrug resistance efflux pump
MAGMVDWYIARVGELSIRNDLHFSDADHLDEDCVLVQDPERWEYTLISRLEYEILVAIDECDSVEAVCRRIYDEHGLRIEAQRVHELLQLGHEHRYFNLWCYGGPLLLPRRRAKKVSAWIDKHRSELDARTLMALETRLPSRDAVALARVAHGMRTDPQKRALAASLLLVLSKQAFAKKAVELDIIQSRFDIFDPDWLVRVLNPIFGWMHGPQVFVFWALLLLLASTTPSEMLEPAFALWKPEAWAFWTPEKIALTYIISMITIFLHEIAGHALSLHRFGGRSPRVGALMFMGVMPAFFANVSDTYRLTKRWQRVWVSAAGLVIDITRGLICLVLLQFTTIGDFFYTVCILNIAISIGSVTTNITPWIKLDGYHMLSELLDLRNLYTRYTAVLGRVLKRIIFGTPLDVSDLSQRERAVIAVFMVGNISFFTTFLLMWIGVVLPRMSFQYGVVALLGIVSLFSAFFVKLWQIVRDTGWRPFVRPRPLLIFGGIAVAVFAVPLPWNLRVPVTLEAQQRLTVVALEDGVVEQTARRGEALAAGATVATLSDATLDLEMRIARAELSAAREHFNAVAGGPQEEAGRAAREKIRALNASQSFYADESRRFAKADGLLEAGALADARLKSITVSAAAQDQLTAEQRVIAQVTTEALAAARSEVEQAALRVERAEQRRERMTLTTAINGRVAKVLKKPGEVVRAGEPIVALVSDDVVPRGSLAASFPLSLLTPGQTGTMRVAHDRVIERASTVDALLPGPQGVEVRFAPVADSGALLVAGEPAVVRVPLKHASIASHVYRLWLASVSQSIRDAYR